MKTEEQDINLEELDAILEDDSLDYLELDSIPGEVYNPFHTPIGISQPDPIEELVGLMCNKTYLHFACKQLLGVDLLPFQLVIMDMLWNKRMPMLIASRGAGKSFILAVYSLMRLVFHPGCKVVVVGAAFRQSKAVFDYMVSVWDKAPILRDIAGKSKKTGPKRDVDRCEFRIGDSVFYALPLGDGTKIRGLRANYILADEFASIPEEVFNVVVQGFGVVASSPVQKVKEAAKIKKLKKHGMWSDEMDEMNKKAAGGNQIVYTGTAYYSFNHFYKFFKKWHAIISSKGDPKKLAEIFQGDEEASKGFVWTDYAILRIPYTHIPEGLMDAGILAQANATLHRSQFLMEYGAIFTSDSDGFYKRSIIESATTNRPIKLQSGEYIQFSAKRTGDPNKSHVLAVDPAADRDNAAIVIIEINLNHRKVVHCWTTNKNRYEKLKKYVKTLGYELDDDYYRYISRKIKNLLKEFNIERIIMDKNGGGTAISEALSSKSNCEEGELPIYQIIDPEDPKEDDIEEGHHILELLAPTTEINSDANHGMLKDLQDKILLFPRFDTVEMAKAIEFDKANEIKFDTYEKLVEEIEELKNEMTSIVCTPSSILGKETFDTPEVKMEGSKKGRLRKDRYSALLYANYYARNRDKNQPVRLAYKPVGGTKHTIKTSMTPNSTNSGNMYRGFGVAKFGQSKWVKSANIRFRKHGM